MLSKIRKEILRTAVIMSGILILLLFSIAALSIVKPSLQFWHLKAPPSEFQAALWNRDIELDDYIGIESRVFKELEMIVQSNVSENLPSPSRYSRFLHKGPNNPLSFSTNWNRTQILKPKNIKGAALLLHGLSDSPYSMRAIAEMLHDAGFYTVVLRTPGHGTTPAGLLHTSWKDWTKVVHSAALHVHQRRNGGPFIIGGYSNGGALALHYTTTQLLTSGNAMPDSLLLFSPALAVTGFARFSNLHKIFSWISYFKKDAWLLLLPEIDPYKYNSFPKNGGAQIWKLSSQVRYLLNKLYNQNKLQTFPRILTFQSAVDTTIDGTAITHVLYNKLPPGRGKLVIFDILRSQDIMPLLYAPPVPDYDSILKTETPYELTLITNTTNSTSIEAKISAQSSNVTIVPQANLRWPEYAFSLSHVAIPFSPTDPIYGDGSGDLPESGLRLGTLYFRGETEVLRIPANHIVRLRFNPFFTYLKRRVIEELKDLVVEAE